MFLTGKGNRAIRRFLEGVVAVVLALASFGILMFVLYVLFPSGTGFRSFFDKGLRSLLEIRQEEAGQGRFRIPDAEGEENLTATISRARNVVKARRAGEIAWSAAGEGMPLYNRDAVQTFGRSFALISLDEKNTLELKENSLVVINRYERDVVSREKRSLLLMVEGTLLGRITGSDEEAVKVDVATAAAVVRIAAPKRDGMPVEFAIQANPDSSSSVAVYRGELKVIAQGTTVTVKANQGTHMKPGERPQIPVLLPVVPVARSPESGVHYVYRDLPPRIRFSWDSPETAESYRFLLARDAEFRDPVVDDEVNAAEFLHGNLEPGEYYWKVSGKRGRLEGTSSEPRRIFLARTQEVPPLRCRELPGTVTGEKVTVIGETEPGASVYVSGDPVPTGAAGEFICEIPLQPGANLILVEAVDPAGNSSYWSQVVHHPN